MASATASAGQAPAKGPQGGTGPQGPLGMAAQGPAGQESLSVQQGQPAPAPKRVSKFRLVEGDHVDDQLNWLPRTRVQEYAAKGGVDPNLSDSAPPGQLSPLRAAVRASKAAERRWRAGSIVACSRPLSTRWPEKFVRVGDEVPETPGTHTLKQPETDVDEPWTESSAQQRWEEGQVRDGLGDLTTNQLRDLAYNEGIELGAANDKPGMLAVIRRVRRSVAGDR